MGIQNITYRTLVNTVVNYIVNNAYNISADRFNIVPDYFKSTYQNKLVYSGKNGSTYTSHAYVSVSSNAVTKVSNTVNTDLVNFLSNSGFTNLDSNMTVPQFISFFNNVVSFCSRYLRYATSQFTQTSYLIYGDTGNSATYTGESDDLIRAKSMNDVMNVLQNRLSLLVRCAPVRYNYTFD